MESFDIKEALSPEVAAPEAPAAPATLQDPTQDPPQDPLGELRQQLDELREAIAKLAAPEPAPAPAFVPSLTPELEALFPGVTEEDIPEEVWQSVKEGVPLSAAYALYERKQAVRANAAKAVNDRNAKGSFGRTDPAPDGGFTPEEVRAMSPAEVHKNYAKIIASMRHW